MRNHKFFNTSLKIRGHLIKIPIRVVVGITIIIEELLGNSLELKFPLYALLPKLFLPTKFTSKDSLLFSIKVDKGICGSPGLGGLQTAGLSPLARL